MTENTMPELTLDPNAAPTLTLDPVVSTPAAPVVQEESLLPSLSSWTTAC